MRVLVFLLLRCLTETSGSCQSDRNHDHRPRVSCTGQGLTAAPGGIQEDTQVLVLSRNSFSTLSWAMFSVFTELHELDLSHNHISSVQPPGPVLEKLSVLRLSGNWLTGLGGQAFRCAPSLLEIYLDRNQLRSLHDGTFSELPLLEIIDLSQNQLPALPPRLLERVSSTTLKTFDLENNSVSLMPDQFFSSKPELPYVFLTHNPWLCSCSVSYLHSFLNDQDYNIYKHNGTNNFKPGADSVLCSGPAHLRRRVIMELEENDFCPPDPPDTPSHSAEHTSAPALTHYSAGPYSPEVTSPDERPDVWSSSLSPELPTVSVKPISSTQTPIPTHATTVDTHLLNSTKSFQTSFETYWVTEVYWVTRHWAEMWFEFWNLTTTPVTSPYLVSQDTTEASTLKSTTPPPSTSSEDPTRSLHPVIAFKTTLQPITDQSQPHSTAITPRVTSAGPLRAEDLESFGRLLPWCWWLFAGFLFLCVLSALTSCLLFLWLLRSYLGVYRRLKRHVSPSRVTLRAYRRSPSAPGPEDESGSVSYLPLEQIRAARAVFRSVLFISRDEQNESSAAERVRDKQRKFRKTLYREISAGQETGGWTEEEESARYSLVLTEERGLQAERRWLVGEWQMGGGGVACEGLCSLIGQPSERSTDGQGSVSTILPMDPHQ